MSPTTGFVYCLCVTWSLDTPLSKVVGGLLFYSGHMVSAVWTVFAGLLMCVACLRSVRRYVEYVLIVISACHSLAMPVPVFSVNLGGRRIARAVLNAFRIYHQSLVVNLMLETCQYRGYAVLYA